MGCCEHCNKPSVLVKCGEFLGCLRIRYVLKKASTPLGRLVGRSIANGSEATCGIEYNNN